jgi:tRNA threonylcarbamoyl adenosine modification protein (Sua5/YciO/YrdC/YwlC family)
MRRHAAGNPDHRLHGRLHLVMLYDCRTVADRDRGIAAAVEAVKSGELVVLPTDTVYGIGADAFTPHAVTALLNAKGRGRHMPPPVLVGSRHTLDGLVYSLPKAARELADAFWPGALTIIVEHSPSLQWDLGDTGGTVAVRMPLHPVALEVLRATGPMAVSSANLTGQPPALTAEQARDQLSYKVSVYLEAGECPHPVPSTIIDLTSDQPKIVRAGAISTDQIREVVGEVIDRDDV